MEPRRGIKGHKAVRKWQGLEQPQLRGGVSRMQLIYL